MNMLQLRGGTTVQHSRTLHFHLMKSINLLDIELGTLVPVPQNVHVHALYVQNASQKICAVCERRYQIAD